MARSVAQSRLNALLVFFLCMLEFRIGSLFTLDIVYSA
jgi:hypothetical protein